MGQPWRRALCTSLFSLAFTGAAFASGGQVFYDFTYKNPADMARVNHAKAEIGYVLVYPVDVAVRANVTNFALPGPQMEMGLAPSKTSYHLPGLALAYRLSPKWIIGLDVSTPFRTKIHYGSKAIVRYESTDLSINVFDISPRVAYQICDKVAVGAGLDIQHEKIYANQFLPNNLELRNEADSWSLGWNVGAYFHPAVGTFLSAVLYTRVDHTVKGTSELVGITKTDQASARFDRPWSIHAAAFQAFSEHVGLYSILRYTHWSFNEAITLHDTAAGTTKLVFDYKNSFRFDIGCRAVSQNQKWITTFGFYVDTTPVTDEHRGVIFPEGDASGLVVTLTYKFTKCFSAKALYSHRFVEVSPINNFESTGAVLTQGQARTDVDAYGLSLAYEI